MKLLGCLVPTMQKIRKRRKRDIEISLRPNERREVRRIKFLGCQLKIKEQSLPQDNSQVGGMLRFFLFFPLCLFELTVQ